MSRLAIDDGDPAEVEVDLWGAVFNMVPITRTRSRALDALAKALDDLDETADGADDEGVRILAEMFDQQLAPTEGKRKKASAWIIEKWKADELSLDQLMRFRERLGEAARPI